MDLYPSEEVAHPFSGWRQCETQSVQFPLDVMRHRGHGVPPCRHMRLPASGQETSRLCLGFGITGVDARLRSMSSYVDINSRHTCTAITARKVEPMLIETV